MGQNLILNVADHKFTVVAFNRTTAKVDRFLENEAKGSPNHALDKSSAQPLEETDSRFRQIHCRRSFGTRVRLKAQEASTDHAACNGW